MIRPTQSFVIADPRTFDGNPYEVAQRAAEQAAALARLLAYATEVARLMARNAQLERELVATGSCDAPAYDRSVEGQRFVRVKYAALEAEKNLKVLALAAGFDPKRPLNA